MRSRFRRIATRLKQGVNCIYISRILGRRCDRQKRFAEKAVLFRACKSYNLEIASAFSDFRITCKRAGDTGILLTAFPRNAGTASTVTQSYVNCRRCNLVKRLNVTTKVSQQGEEVPKTRDINWCNSLSRVTPGTQGQYLPIDLDYTS